MAGSKTLLLFFCASALVGTVSTTVVAQDTETRTVEQVTCKDVMREDSTSRDAAIAFLDGFLLGKAGQSSYNVGALTKKTDAFIDACLDNPTAKAIDVLTKAKM